MNISSFPIEGLLLLTPKRFGDDRGFFSEVFRQDLFEAAAGKQGFVQDNHSFSREKGVLRGLHYQAPPMAQGKLVRVTRGAVLDVAVDIRHGSPTYGQHVSVELSAENWRQLWIPPGFLHGFCTLTENVEFLYKVTNPYSPEHDGAVAHDDPDLAIEWPFPPEQLILSPKDRAAPHLRDLPPIFQAE
ncbi:MAG: dTDP-4-dehydrorhamnose 3,5-epimerase [Proteobacteria bacterium]|nr:dTDP-4-dehydrorhamnose 3,5-epimerase [Pseudomonadota bacterium]